MRHLLHPNRVRLLFSDITLARKERSSRIAVIQVSFIKNTDHTQGMNVQVMMITFITMNIMI